MYSYPCSYLYTSCMTFANSPVTAIQSMTSVLIRTEVLISSCGIQKLFGGFYWNLYYRACFPQAIMERLTIWFRKKLEVTNDTSSWAQRINPSTNSSVIFLNMSYPILIFLSNTFIVFFYQLFPSKHCFSCMLSLFSFIIKLNLYFQFNLGEKEFQLERIILFWENVFWRILIMSRVWSFMQVSWRQSCGSGSSKFGQCGSGSLKFGQCGSGSLTIKKIHQIFQNISILFL